MNGKRSIAIVLSSVLLALAMAAQAQGNPPHAAYVYPAGGRQGSDFAVTVGGQYLNSAQSALVSGDGVKAEFIGLYKPLSPAEIADLRERLKRLQDKKKAGTWTAADASSSAEIRQKIATSLKRRDNPAFADLVTLRMTIAPGAAPGKRELRLLANNGVTNPLVFYVDPLPEVTKPPAWQAPLEPEDLALKNRSPQRASASAADPPLDIALPATVNGEIMPGGVDRYRFPARKGQPLVFAARTRDLIPYISDAVPGWFQAALTLYDAGGNEVAYADNDRFEQQPVILYKVPADGEYTLEVRDTLYRGREDFVYRIQMGELPFVTGVFPLGGKAGSAALLELAGWNLPVRKLKLPLTEPGVQPISIREGRWQSNPILLAADSLPEVPANKTNHSAAQAQPLRLPVIVNGRIGAPNQWSVFRFHGRAGEEMVAEVLARRLNSPLDSVLRLTDAAGREIAFNDDFEDRGAALLTHQADSRLSVKLPRTGTYYLYLGDSQHQGGPEYSYRLRLSAPRPDFELRIVPASISLHPGMMAPISVFLLRRDGFSGEVTVQLKDAPRGWVLTGGRIPAGQDSVRMTLAAPAGQAQPPQLLTLEGAALVGGREVRRHAVPAEDMMQAFAWHHLVPAQTYLAVVNGGGLGRETPWKYADEQPLQLPAGGSAQVLMTLPAPFANQAVQRLHLDLDAAPEGIAIEKVTLSGQSLVVRLRSMAGKVKPGLKGNLIVDASLDPPVPAADKKPQANHRRTPLGVLPAIPFEIVAR
jgi:hypothetical protein